MTKKRNESFANHRQVLRELQQIIRGHLMSTEHKVLTSPVQIFIIFGVFVYARNKTRCVKFQTSVPTGSL